MAAQTYTGYSQPADLPTWEAALEHIAMRNCEHLLAHPWLAEAPQGRPILGPGICRKYEAELAALDGIGLSDVDMDLTLSALMGQVTQAARWQGALGRVREESHLSDEQWWALYGPRLAAAMSGEELPISGRVGQNVASAGDPEATWRFALAALVDKLHAIVGTNEL